MTGKVQYLDRINGEKVVGGVSGTKDGRKVRLHAVRRWGKLYWTADRGDTFAVTKVEAYSLAATIDVVTE